METRGTRATLQSAPAATAAAVAEPQAPQPDWPRVLADSVSEVVKDREAMRRWRDRAEYQFD